MMRGTSIKLIVALAALLALPAVASAQHAEQPPGQPGVPTHGEGGGGGHAVPHEGGHGAAHHADPSQNFNWFGHPAPFGSSSYKSVDQQGGPLGDDALGPEKAPLPPGAHEEAMSVPFVLVLINFGIVLFILGWKVGPMARQMAEKRSDEIKGALDEAARLRKQAADKLTEYSSKLSAAESEIERLIKDMRSDAEADRARIIAAAEAQAIAMKKEAEERIAAEIERARYMLQKEVVLAATAVAEQLLRSRTTAADQATLVDSFIKNVDGAAGASPR